MQICWLRGARRRAGHPRVTTVLPEGWEDIHCTFADGGQLHVQSKERAERAERLGLADIADAVAHAATSLSAGTQAVSAALRLRRGHVISGDPRGGGASYAPGLAISIRCFAAAVVAGSP